MKKTTKPKTKKYKVVCMNETGTPKYLCHYTVTNGKHEWRGASSEAYCKKLADRINRFLSFTV